MRLLFIILSLFVTIPAYADTFTITSGTAFLNQGTLGFNVAGPNFAAQGGDTPALFAGPVMAGQPYVANGVLFLDGGVFDINGVRYSGSTGNATDSIWRLVATTPVPSNFTGGTLAGLATLTANVRVTDFATGLFTEHTILGSGTALFQLGGTGSLGFSRVDVTFSVPNGGTNTNGAVPTVPEPGTWLLLLTGLAGLWSRRLQGKQVCN